MHLGTRCGPPEAGDSGKKRTFDFAIIAGLDARVTAGTGAAAGAYEGIWRMIERAMTVEGIEITSAVVSALT